MTEEGMKTLVMRLAAFESASPWNAEKTVMYAEALRYIPDDITLKAIKILAVTKDWRPTLAQLMAKIVEIDDPVPPVGKAMRQVRDVIDGYQKSVHAAVAMAIGDIGGLDSVRRMNAADFERRFASAYEKAQTQFNEKRVVEIAEGERMVSSLQERTGREITRKAVAAITDGTRR